MKPGEIWGWKNPQTGEKKGYKVTEYFPPMGQSLRHIAFVENVKDATLKTTLVLTAEGIPMLKDGSASSNWKLIEEAPRGTDKR